MKSHYITTVYGPDIPGVLKSLALITREHKGEWLSSKVIKIDGQFAAIMSVVIAGESEQPLKKALEEAFPRLQFNYAPPLPVTGKSTKTIHLVVDCIDRPGLTGDLSTILNNLDIDVETMECKRSTMDAIGDVFSAQLAIVVPESTDSQVIAGEIEALSEDVQVNVLD